MKRNHWLGVAVAAAVCWASGCATSSPLSRIDSNRAAYESWPIEMQQAVLDGKAAPGMTPEMVRMAIGEPTEVSTRPGKNGEDQVWIYRKSDGLGLLKNTGLSVGGGIGGVSVGGGGRRGGSRAATSDEREVVFQNGVVIRADP